MASKRIEHGILDRLISGKLLGKRKLGNAVKYNFDGVKNRNHTRIHESLYFPKNAFDRFLGNVYERCLPGFQYFIWNEQVKWARYHGYTLAEKMQHSWRSAPNVMLHALAQTIHPWGYLENQRRDQFIRKVTVLLPGIECPDWAQENKRVSDYDLNSTMAPKIAFTEVLRESTPTPHILPPNYTALHHILNQRFNLGNPAQRLFYNEELRGDYYSQTILTKSDKAQIHGWYADAQKESQVDRIKAMSDSERAEYLKNKERWDNNFKNFYPELHVVKYNPVMHKYDEPHYERNVNDIRVSVFTSKWEDALHRGVFTTDEIHEVHSFFLEDNTNAFFQRAHHDSDYEATPLFKKFQKELDFPDLHKIDRFTTYPPEKQFYDIMDKNWGINFDTVDAFKRNYLTMLSNNSDSNINSLVLEEVYNPVFRKLLNRKFNIVVKQTESITLKALEKGESLADIQALAQDARANTHLTSSKSLKNMVDNQVRKIVSTFTVKGL